MASIEFGSSLWSRRSPKENIAEFLLAICAVLLLTAHPIQANCTFPAGWSGAWFQSGAPRLLAVNATHIDTKGICYESEGNEKFVLYDRTENCYRCMVIHEKHDSVLQYKETYCYGKASLNIICDDISGDAPLLSMFRKSPPPAPHDCPFRQAPFTFTYNRGSGDCISPPSKAESCTDDSRLLLRYQACPDVPGTESNVEELICLASWKEGSTRYLVGKITQPNRMNTLTTDEDSYRCFVYKGSHAGGRSTYSVAQSGDATCNGLISATEGSRTMTLTTGDDHHKRCHFPSWITEHHKWYSLDRTKSYHFTQRNATLKIENVEGSADEMRLVCHTITQEPADNKFIQIVAHRTRGCESGHVCLTFHHRSSGVIEVQQSTEVTEMAEDACRGGTKYQPYVTLHATTLHPKPCPHLGRYNVIGSSVDRRIRRQQTGETSVGAAADDGGTSQEVERACVATTVDSVLVGCSGAQDTLHFKSPCATTSYTCHGGWYESGLHFLIASPNSRSSTDPRTYCFVYSMPTPANDSRMSTGRSPEPPVLRLSAVAASCDRSVKPGLGGHRAYNLTINGTCAQSSQYNSGAHRICLATFGGMFTLCLSVLLTVFTR